MSRVFVVVIARDYLYLFVSLSLDHHFGVWNRSTVWRHCGVKGVTQPLHQTISVVVRLFIRKVKFGTAFVVQVGVGTADVCARTSDNVGSSDTNVVTSDSD